MKECESCADQLKRTFDFRSDEETPVMSITQPVLVLRNDENIDWAVTTLIRKTNVTRLRDMMRDGIHHPNYQMRELRHIKHLLGTKDKSPSPDLSEAIQAYHRRGYDMVKLIDTIQRYCGVNVQLTSHHTGLLELTWMGPKDELISIHIG